jgi:hypothetical protein
MALGLGRYRRALDHLLHQIDTTTWTIQLITEHLIRRTRGRTETAVHAFVNNGFNRANVGIIAELGRYIDLHLTSPDRVGPG